MLPKAHRLSKKKDFELVLKKGKGFRADFLVLEKNKNNLNQTRFGFIVGRKISKKATLRNKIKRRLRRIVQMKLSEIKTGWDIVLIARPGLENKNFREMEIILNKVLKRAKVINK